MLEASRRPICAVEMNQSLSFQGVTDAIFTSIRRRSLVIMLKARAVLSIVPAPLLDPELKDPWDLWGKNVPWMQRNSKSSAVRQRDSAAMVVLCLSSDPLLLKKSCTQLLLRAPCNTPKLLRRTAGAVPLGLPLAATSRALSCVVHPRASRSASCAGAAAAATATASFAPSFRGTACNVSAALGGLAAAAVGTRASSAVTSAVASAAIAKELGTSNVTAREAVTLGRQGAEPAGEGVTPCQALRALAGAARLFAAVTREATPRR